MSTIIEAAAAVNPARLTACPRCGGEGRVKYSRPGGWLIEPCSVCGTTGLLDPETAETVRVLQKHADAALGVVDGRCCTPEEGGDPCVSCVPPDLFPDVPFVPSEADEADYRAWCREHHDRLLSDRIAADEDAAWKAQCRREDDARLVAGILVALQADTFQEMLAGFANALTDHACPDARWVGGKIGELYDRARWLEAKSGEQFDDRLACHLDAIQATHAGR